MTEEPYQSAAKGVKSPITAEKITDWLVNNKVLSIALGGTYRTDGMFLGLLHILSAVISLCQLNIHCGMRVGGMRCRRSENTSLCVPFGV